MATASATRSATGWGALDPRVRSGILVVGSVGATLAFTQLVLPGVDGSGTPMAIVFSGLVSGLLNALTALGIVLIYRSHRIINFAQAAIGVGGGVFAANLVSLLNWPYFVAFVAGVLVAAGLALVFQLVFVIRFFNAPRLALTILTIAAIPAIQFATGLISTLPIFPPPADRTPDQALGAFTTPFPGFDFQVGGFTLQFGFVHLFAIGMSIVAMAGLFAFFRFTRVGVAIRGAAENNERARMLGISVVVLSMIAWGIAGALSGLSVVLGGSLQGQIAPGVIPPELLIVPLIAAAVARFEGYPTAVVAAVLITIVRRCVGFSYADDLPLVDIGLLVLVLGSFLVARRRSGRAEESEATAFESASEQRPIPRELLELPSVSLTRLGFAIAAAIGLVVFPLAGTPGQVELASFLILFAIAMLSMIPLTGWAGQASLGQFAFVAVAAVVAGALTARVGINFWIVLIIIPFFTAGFTLLMGVPALRIRGLFLAVATAAFAIAVQSALFNEKYFGWLLPGSIERPTLFFLDFEDTRSNYYLSLVFLAAAVFLVVMLRRSRPGRVLIALRENENNLRSFGVNPTRMRLAAFAFSGFLCGLAGVALAHHQRAVTMQDFPFQSSLDVFLFSIVGGVGSVFGVMLGALYFSLQRLITNPLWALVLGPFGVLLILYVSPGGLAALFTTMRDGVLRIVAQRRQMVVPALFADIDPATAERQLIPLAEPIGGSGLDALPLDRRYTSTSELYGSRGQELEDGDRRQTEESTAFDAAAHGFGGEE